MRRKEQKGQEIDFPAAMGPFAELGGNWPPRVRPAAPGTTAFSAWAHGTRGAATFADALQEEINDGHDA
ncbi:MAG: hypothetical protein M3R02_21010, partial [Chloroflexota bacterium]|nr:hypothetical protein [Chloroflexota bacterium]